MSDGKTIPSRRESRREWALEWLDEDLDISPEQAQSKWLRNLAEQDFVPYEGSFEAFQVLSDRNGSDPAARSCDIQIHHERRLIEAVESLADQFFQTPPDRRRLLWQSYRGQCEECSRAVDHLERLKPGLDVILPEPTGEALCDELSSTTCRLFTLNPLHRAQRLQDLLKRVSQNPASWEMAARRLEHDRPDVAALLPDLFRRLTSLQKELRKESSRISRRRKDSRSVEKKSGSTSGIPWYWWVVGVIVIRAIASPAMRYLDSAPSSRPSKITFPKSNPENQFRVPGKQLSSESVERWLEAQRKVQREQAERDEFNPFIQTDKREQLRQLQKFRERMEALPEQSIRDLPHSLPYAGRTGKPVSERERLKIRLAEISSEMITLTNDETNRKPGFPKNSTREARLKSLRSEAALLWKHLKELRKKDFESDSNTEESSPNLDAFGPAP